MADIELVIKIPKRVYNYIRKYEHIANSDVLDIKDAIINGTPLPKGHWIDTGDYYTGAYGTINYVKCSCCGEDSLEEGDYCPNCGADMREVKE